ncbi:hypothetical protein [Paenibacillus sp.]|nr:hypothetical protein [Paenibacillus sp.]
MNGRTDGQTEGRKEGRKNSVAPELDASLYWGENGINPVEMTELGAGGK